MISKIDFNSYIESLAKDPGEYTSEELYQIGIRHKQLPQNEKNWKELSQIVGYAGAPNSYRCFVNREQAKRGTLPMKDEKAIESNVNEFEEMYKERTKVRDAYNNYRSDLRAEARLDSFKESLVKAVKEIKPLPATKITKKSITKNATEAILMLSDLHLGVNCHNFYNTYNYEVAKERIAKLAADTIKYCNLYNVTKLNVINLGDMIHGIIHVTSRIQEESTLVDQITKAAELVAWLLNELNNKLNTRITYRSCTDNHSRAVANLHQNLEEENFNRIIDWYLKARLTNTTIEFKNDNIDVSLGKFDLLNGKKVMFAHGHLENVNKCIDAFCGATKQFIDYVLISHYHNSREKAYNGSKLLINGSIVGTDEYALSKRLFGPAEQKLLIFDNDDFIDININLQ